MNNLDTNSHSINQFNIDCQDERLSQTLFSISNGNIGLKSSLIDDEYVSSPGIFLKKFYDRTLAVNSELVNLNNEVEIEIIVDSEKVDFLSNNVLSNYNKKLDYETNELNIYAYLNHKQFQCEIEISKIAHFKYKDLIITKINIKDLKGNFKTISFNVLRSKRSHNDYMGVEPEININHLKSTYYSLDKDYQEMEFHSLSNQKIEWKMKQETKDFQILPIRAFDDWGYSFKYFTKNNNKDLCIKIIESIHLISDSNLNNSKGEFYNLTYDELLESHKKYWKKYNGNFKLVISGNNFLNNSLQFNINKLIQNVDNTDVNQNFASRGLTSEYHSGHFFFNTEFFKLIFFTHTYPSIARSFLKFRFSTLNAAQKLAKLNNKEGAFFAEEVNDQGHLSSAYKIENLNFGKTYYDNSGILKFFVTGAVAYGVVYYYENTLDNEFMNHEGKKILYESALFAKSLFKYNTQNKKFCIEHTMGPDEYHYPINNSFFVNFIMKKTIQWAVKYSFDLFENNDINLLNKISNNIYLPKSKGGIIQQFDGYFGLKDKKITNYDSNGRPILDNKDYKKKEYLENIDSQIIKEADLLLLMKLLPKEFSKKEMEETLSYYESRTAHESSLSSAPYGLINSFLEKDIKKILNLFYLSSRYDLDFIPSNKFNNGIHFAAYAGAWEIIVFGICGLHLKDDSLFLKPHKDLFTQIKSISFFFFYRNKKYDIYIDSKKTIISKERF